MDGINGKMNVRFKMKKGLRMTPKTLAFISSLMELFY